MKLWREKPGVLSESAVWVLQYGMWLHLHTSLLKLLYEVVTEFKHDKHIVG